MKRSIFLTLLTGSLISIGVAGMAVACSNGQTEESPQLPVYPTMPCRQIQLSETIMEDRQIIHISHAYTYTEGHLSDYLFQQSYSLQGIETPFLIENHATVTYKEEKVLIRDSHGNSWTYILDAEGHAIGCTYREETGHTRTYTFAYTVCSDGQQRLTELSEQIDDEATSYASLYITYEENDILHITQQIGDYRQTFTSTPSEEKDATNAAGLPCLFITELYPLSQCHVALYAKLLGEPTAHLPRQIVPEQNTEESGETITYTYGFDDNGMPASCLQTICSNGTSYERSIIYTVE